MSGGGEAEFRAHLLGGQALSLASYDSLLRRRFPELAILADVPPGRGEGRRGESALEHTQRVLDLVQAELPGLPVEQAQALYLAALLHEVGRGPLGERDVTTSRHERAGGPLARDVLFRLRVAPRLREQVVDLVRSHALPRVLGRRPPGPGRLLRLAWTVDTRALYLLASAACRAGAEVGLARCTGAVGAYREQCERLGVFGREPSPLLSPQRWRELAPADARLRRRSAGELRFARLKGTIATAREAEQWLRAQAPEPAGALYLPLGVPGSGKSTWVARHLQRARLISMDEMRERLTGGRADQSRYPEVFRRCRGELGRALRAGETVAWDAQSHTWAARQGLLALARETHAYVILVYFDVPLSVALERNARREAAVPEAVVMRSYADLQAPRPFEAEEIWRVDVNGRCSRYVWDEEAGA